MAKNYGWIEINKKLLYKRDYYYTPSLLARTTFSYVLGAGHFVCHRDFRLKRKEYKCCLVKYTLNGTGYLNYRGKQYVLGRNSIMFLDCNDFQEYYTYNCDSWENIWVHFGGSTSYEYFNMVYQTYGPVLEMPEGCNIPGYITQLIDWMECEDLQFEIKAYPVITEILTSILLNARIEFKSSSRAGIPDYIQTALDYIEKNYYRNICVEDMAEIVKVSLFHFTRQFKKAVGFSPYEYLVKYRMNKAKSLLLYTNMTIEEISTAVGFQDESTFIRAFKRLEATTPQKFRINL